MQPKIMGQTESLTVLSAETIGMTKVVGTAGNWEPTENPVPLARAALTRRCLFN